MGTSKARGKKRLGREDFVETQKFLESPPINHSDISVSEVDLLVTVFSQK